MSFPKVYIYFSELNQEIFTVTALDREYADNQVKLFNYNSNYIFVGVVDVSVIGCQLFKVPLN